MVDTACDKRSTYHAAVEPTKVLKLFFSFSDSFRSILTSRLLYWGILAFYQSFSVFSPTPRRIISVLLGASAPYSPHPFPLHF